MSNDHIKLLKKCNITWIYPIYVPSYNRAGTSPLLEMLQDAPRSVQRKVHIVVRPEEVKAYSSAYPWAFVIPESEPGIGPARMRCLIDAEEQGYSYITVLDDDIIHLSLLERISRENGTQHTRRHSSRVSGIPEPMLLLRSLAVACRLSQAVFDTEEYVSYGAARNALFSGDVDPEIGATLYQGSFPACVMFFHVERFSMREMPEAYQYHGEDLAMFLHAMEQEEEVFTLPGVAYDQHGGIETTIPLDPLDAIGRPHLQTTEYHFPFMHQFLRVSMKNKLGGVMRIGVNWKRWYKETNSDPHQIPLSDLIKEI